MSELTVHIIFWSLIALICLSAFFSGAETGMMAINRYRLRHLARKKHRGAIRVQELLRRPDRLLGMILIGNNFANIFAAALATLIAVHWLGEVGVIVASLSLTFVILIFAEVTPKTLAALYPEKVAFPASLPLKILLKLLYPLVWLINGISNGILTIFRIKVRPHTLERLTREELRSVVHESGSKQAEDYHAMMLGVLDLERVTVDDIMVPRNRIVGINLQDDWQDILLQLTTSQHTRMPIYSDNIDQVRGMIHARGVLNLMAKRDINQNNLLKAAEEVYFVPEGTPLNIQLINFQKQQKRIAMVVDEYGDIQGLVTLEDILEEIVGEFTTNVAERQRLFIAEEDGGFIVDGEINIRDLNRELNWELPVDGPKTLNGLIVEQIEAIPIAHVSVKISDHPIEILKVKENKVISVKIWPKLREPASE